MNNIEFQYPTWYLLLCIGLGIAFAVALYLRDQRFREQFSTLNLTLGILRGLLVTLLALLLLTPLIRSLSTNTQEPIVVVAQDVSESIFATTDANDQAQYLQQLNGLTTALEEQYEVVNYSYGSEVRRGIDTSFNDKSSNIAAVLSEIYDQYSNQNLGAIVLASDGIYNQGSNPIYSSTKLAVPIYSIALGDTIPKKDLILRRAFYNKIAYLDDRFAVQVDISALNSRGKTTTLTVSKVVNGEATTLQRETIAIDQDDFFTTRELTLTADQVGVQRFKVELSGLADEVSYSNNSRTIFVDVLDARQKILVLADAPHPDLTALKQTLASNKNYEIETAYAGKFEKNIAAFDFVILHQLPSAKHPITNIRNSIRQQKTPHLYIVGSQTNLNAFNQSQELLTIQGDGRNTDEVQPILQKDFSLFTLEEDLNKELNRYPPAIAPFGNYAANPNASILLKQRIGRIDTERPLVLLGEEEGTKVGVIAAEGLWKWRLFDYLQHKNHDVFDELMGKIVQFISIKEDKRRFRVSLEKNVFYENETIIFQSQLYNENYEPVNTPDASLILTNEEGNDFDFIFNKKNNAYELNVGVLAVGNYTYKGTTIFNGRQLQVEGQLSVQPVQLELYATTADHNLLRLLSEEYGGQVIYPNAMDNLPALVEGKGNVKPVIYQTAKTSPIINFKWICLLLIVLMSVEWFLRRYFGAY